MRHHTVSLAVVSLSFAGILIGCAAPANPPQSQGTSYERVENYTGTGVVESIEVTQKESSGVAGTVIGGVAGGLLGSTIGGGTGQVAATVAGAAGGAYAGNKIQRNNAASHPVYNIRVRMNDGRTMNFAQENGTDLRVGDRVRIDNGRLSRY